MNFRISELLLAFAFFAGLAGAQPAKPDAAWNAKAAAAYLDQRMAWWVDWSNAQRDHQTFCISCHTSARMRWRARR
jgi:hypothetical protein